MNANRWYVSYILDALILVIICLNSLLPSDRVSLLGIAFQAQAFLQLALVFFLVIRILIKGMTKFYKPFLMFSVLCLIYAQASIAFGLAEPIDIYNHLITMFPFFVACLFLASGTTINPVRALWAISLCLSISAGFHIYCYLYAPEIFFKAVRDQVLMQHHIDWGRVSWIGASNVFFIILLWWVPILSVRRQIITSLCLAVSLVAVLIGFSRTIIGGLVLFAIYLFFSPSVTTSWRKKATYAVGLYMLLAIGVSWVITSNEKAAQLFESRILGHGQFEQLSESDIVGREILYRQYIERLDESILVPLIGQGFGVPLSINVFGEKVAYADVTFVVFLLTFGIFGVLCWGLLILNMWKVLHVEKLGPVYGLARGLKCIIVISILVSLNFNIWLAKSFIYYLAFIVSAVYCENRKFVNFRREKKV